MGCGHRRPYEKMTFESRLEDWEVGVTPGTKEANSRYKKVKRITKALRWKNLGLFQEQKGGQKQWSITNNWASRVKKLILDRSQVRQSHNQRIWISS
jgi:predicted transcriptional regulator